VDHKFWVDQHYEGGYLFRDTVIMEITPPENEGGSWQIAYDWQSDHLGQATSSITPKALKSGKQEVGIPFDSQTTPGIRGNLRFVVSAWNA
jgi:hypothetical protein